MSLTIIKKTEISKLDTFNKWKQNPGKGEVFTPKELVNEMLDQIPTEVWENPKSTFCDPFMGKGTFLVEIVNRLVYIYGYKEEDAKSRVFGYEIRVKYVNYLKRRGYKNVFYKDSLTEKFNMEFDVVLGNPPYQKKVGPKKTEAIWPKFVEKSFEICKEGGYVSLIHPIGWRDIDGKYKKIQKILLDKEVKYIEMHNIKDGVKMFGVKTPFDWYTIKNEHNRTNQTKIKDQNGLISDLNITNLNFIPNCNFEFILNLIAKGDEETVDVLYDCAYHHQYSNTNKISDGEFLYPCVYSVKNNNTATFYFSNTNNKGHFNIPKVIFGNGANPTYMLDPYGEYGMCEFAFGVINYDISIIDLALKSKKIKKITESLKYNNTQGQPIFNRKILATFRKDFWVDFLDENNNVIEPNHKND